MSSPFFKDIPDPRPPRRVRVLTPAMSRELEKVRIQNKATRDRDRAWVRWATIVTTAMSLQLLTLTGMEMDWVFWLVWVAVATLAWQIQDRFIKARLKVDLADYHVDGDNDGSV